MISVFYNFWEKNNKIVIIMIDLVFEEILLYHNNEFKE